MAFRQFFFDTPELSNFKTKLSSILAKSILAPSTKRNPYRIFRKPDRTYTEYNVSWRIFQCSISVPSFDFLDTC